MNQKSREDRAAKRAAENEAKDKLKRKRPGKFQKFLIHIVIENVNREVFALLGDQDPQMVPVEEKPAEDERKKIPQLDRPVDKWVWHPFQNPARDDKAQFCHWTKKKEAGDVYAFARFNRKASVITYTDDQYERVVAPLKSDWTKLETDVLFELCERFNLRFIIIADRFAYELQDKIES